MEQLIPTNPWCPFRLRPAGWTEVWIVLVQLGMGGAGNNGSPFIVTKLRSEKTVTATGSRHDRIQLLTLNLVFEPI